MSTKDTRMMFAANKASSSILVMLPAAAPTSIFFAGTRATTTPEHAGGFLWIIKMCYLPFGLVSLCLPSSGGSSLCGTRVTSSARSKSTMPRRKPSTYRPQPQPQSPPRSLRSPVRLLRPDPHNSPRSVRSTQTVRALPASSIRSPGRTSLLSRGQTGCELIRLGSDTVQAWLPGNARTSVGRLCE